MNKEYLNNNSFNNIRLFFCIVVVYCHVCALTGYSSNFLNIINPAHISVCVFFILSGFWISHSYLKCINIWEFYKKRFLRIFPAYLFIVWFFAFILSLFSDLSVKSYFLNKDFISYLFWNTITLNFIQSKLPGVFSNNILTAVNGSLWTIKCEVGFYIILPLIFYFIKKRKNITLIIIYVFSVIYQISMPIICDRFKLPDALINQLPTFLSYFVSGIFCYLYLDKLQNKWKMYCVLACIILLLHFITQTEILFPFFLSVFIILLGFNIHKNIINIDLSYEIYLIHFPIIQMFVCKELFNTNRMLLFVFSLCITVFFAFIIKVITNNIGKKV